MSKNENNFILDEETQKELKSIKDMQKHVLKLMGLQGSKKASILVKYDDIEEKIHKIIEENVIVDPEKNLNEIYSFFEQIDKLFNDFIEGLEKKYE